MNREIKFRAWDKKSKRMLPIIVMRWNDIGIPDTNMELLQFTGLKDKNGKEIYEGDIVKFRDVRTNKDWVDGVVYWSGTEARFKADYWSFGNEIYTSTLEVIGTIYENPELLTQEQEVRE